MQFGHLSASETRPYRAIGHIQWLARLFMLIVMAFGAGVALAQNAEIESSPLETTAFRQLFVFAGPGATHGQVGILNPGVPVTIVERNHTGNWVRVVITAEDDAVRLDGWIVSGFLNHDDNLRYSEVPVNDEIADANPENVDALSLARLYEAPIIPQISAAMHGVYQRGQQMGNHNDVVTKVGDSVSANPMYLTLMSGTEHKLGPYDYLAETLDYFGPSLQTQSVASRIGLSTQVVFDPFWSAREVCLPDESPLECEYRLKQPAVAMIMFGPNDVRHMTEEEYGEQMRLIVEETLGMGIIPVLTTFSADPDAAFWWQSVNFNLRLVEVADEYDVPLVNLWAATRILPQYGLDRDRIHMQNSGFTFLKYDTGHEAFYGVSLQNLLALRVLDEIRRELELS